MEQRSGITSSLKSDIHHLDSIAEKSFNQRNAAMLQGITLGDQEVEFSVENDRFFSYARLDSLVF